MNDASLHAKRDVRGDQGWTCSPPPPLGPAGALACVCMCLHRPALPRSVGPPPPHQFCYNCPNRPSCSNEQPPAPRRITIMPPRASVLKCGAEHAVQQWYLPPRSEDPAHTVPTAPSVPARPNEPATPPPHARTFVLKCGVEHAVQQYLQGGREARLQAVHRVRHLQEVKCCSEREGTHGWVMGDSSRNGFHLW